MTRAAVLVRTATPDDIPALADLLAELRAEGPRRGTRAPAPEGVETTFRVALADPTCRVVVAVHDDEVIGMAQLLRARPTLLSDTSSVELTAMCVSHRHRRRGAGKALVAAATSYAEELAVDAVLVSVYPQHRDANRFYARLGFAPVVVRRVASVVALRRRLGTPEGRAAQLRRDLHVHVPTRASLARRARAARPAPVPTPKD